MTPSWGGTWSSSGAGRGSAEDLERRKPTWPRALAVLALVGLIFVVAKGCQKSQVRITQERAVEIAKQQIDFKPKLTVVRFLRQGLNRKPYWFVSLSIPIGDENSKLYSRLAVVEIDANTGKVTKVSEQSAKENAKQKTQAAQEAGAGKAKAP